MASAVDPRIMPYHHQTTLYHFSATCHILCATVKVEGSDTSLLLDTGAANSIELDEPSSYIRRHQSSSITDGDTSLPNGPLVASGTSIVVDTTQPVVTGVYGVNGDGKTGAMRWGRRERRSRGSGVPLKSFIQQRISGRPSESVRSYCSCARSEATQCSTCHQQSISCMHAKKSTTKTFATIFNLAPIDRLVLGMLPFESRIAPK